MKFANISYPMTPFLQAAVGRRTFWFEYQWAPESGNPTGKESKRCQNKEGSGFSCYCHLHKNINSIATKNGDLYFIIKHKDDQYVYSKMNTDNHIYFLLQEQGLTNEVKELQHKVQNKEWLLISLRLCMKQVLTYDSYCFRGILLLMKIKNCTSH